MTTRFLASMLSGLALATLSGCMTPPADLDLSLQRPSQDRQFVVALQLPATPPAINQIHSWQVKLSTPDGAPVSHARISVDGGMPNAGGPDRMLPAALGTRSVVLEEVLDRVSKEYGRLAAASAAYDLEYARRR